MGIIKFAVKSSLAGGLVYYTVQEGLWSHNADDSVKFYNKIYAGVAPYLKDSIPKDIINEIPQFPSAHSVSTYTSRMWNCGIKSSFKLISELPVYVSNGVDSLKSAMNQVNQEPSSQPDAKKNEK